MRLDSLLTILGAVLAVACSVSAETTPALTKAGDLRLVPFPKQVKLLKGGFELPRMVWLGVSEGIVAQRMAADLQTELGLAKVKGRDAQVLAKSGRLLLVLSAKEPDPEVVAAALGQLPSQDEGYGLVVTKDFAAVGARTEAGLACGAQTLRQLIRANLQGRVLPAVEITDWPSLRYRGCQDDITRGPSPRLATLERDASLTGLLKMNCFSLYQEYQFAFKKHPAIGPKDGSLLPEELKSLDQYAASRGVEVIGCQQSFGHFGRILRDDQYASLRETGDIINPTNDKSYELLDDMYSEEIPLTKSKFFNICCDETFGLGTGPSKPLADKIGVGGVYAMHIKRIHDLLRDKYGKRTMMWGDIISQHPDHLAEIPKDTIMLSWNYGPFETFEGEVIPFEKSGYDFFVCPGTSNWGRVVPDFTTAVTNIHNYVRDGIKHGAMGMLNTSWMDDGETFFACNWHGFAWGAECAWNASTTAVEDFDRRIGAVLFGEKGDHFGQAIALLKKVYGSFGSGLWDGLFWENQSPMVSSRQAAREQATSLLKTVDSALVQLETVKSEAKTNGDILDYLIFCTRRVRLMATRRLDYFDAVEAYQRALDANDPKVAQPHLLKAAEIIKSLRDQHSQLRKQYSELWLKESKPYALDWMMAKFDKLASSDDHTLTALAAAVKSGVLPAAKAVGLEVIEIGVRSTRASSVGDILSSSAPWHYPDCESRVGITVDSGDKARCDQPIEIDMLPGQYKRFRLVEVEEASGKQTPVICQGHQDNAQFRLAFLMPGSLPAKSHRSFFLYYGSASAVGDKPGVTVTDAPKGMKVVENDQTRLLIGPEGAHIYRWEVKALGDLDLTEPGDVGWGGFADINGLARTSQNTLDVLEKGPVLARIRCTDEFGTEKTIAIWAGVPWAEVTLRTPSNWLASYDNDRIMGADSPTPGTYLFSDGNTGKVKKTSMFDSQAVRDGAFWCAKYVDGGPVLALLTPELPCRHYVGPGGGMGGVGIESGPAASHFVIYGGKCPASLKNVLDTLRDTLDYMHPPAVTFHKPENRH